MEGNEVVRRSEGEKWAGLLSWEVGHEPLGGGRSVEIRWQWLSRNYPIDSTDSMCMHCNITSLRLLCTLQAASCCALNFLS
jgi:hypothetical protein